MYAYYGLTKEEKTNKKVIYKKNESYDGKGINLTLKGLKQFIKDEKMEELIKYYAKVSLKNFKVIKTIIKDKKYDMITVEIPFEIEFKKTYKINWR